jgi:hypothetical protein
MTTRTRRLLTSVTSAWAAAAVAAVAVITGGCAASSYPQAFCKSPTTGGMPCSCWRRKPSRRRRLSPAFCRFLRAGAMAAPR